MDRDEIWAEQSRDAHAEAEEAAHALAMAHTHGDGDADERSKLALRAYLASERATAIDRAWVAEAATRGVQLEP